MWHGQEKVLRPNVGEPWARGQPWAKFADDSGCDTMTSDPDDDEIDDMLAELGEHDDNIKKMIHDGIPRAWILATSREAKMARSIEANKDCLTPE